MGKFYLTTRYTYPFKLTILLLDMRKTAGTVTNISLLMCWIAKDESMWRNIACYNRPRTYQCKFSDSYATDNNGPCTNRSPKFYQGWRNLPIISAFEFTARRNSTRQQIVGEAYMGTNEDAIFEC